jgi:hypothetical protein
MNSADFKKLISNHFSPRIRELGWKGSGFSYYKPTNNHVVNIFSLHGSWMGGSITCETAIHFDFIPDLAGRDYRKTTSASCIVRQPLAPKSDWWFHSNEEQNRKSVEQIWKAFQQTEISFYKDFQNFPEPFSSIKPEDFDRKRLFGFGSRKNLKILGKYHIYNEINLIWLLKEIHELFGNPHSAKAFSELGMKYALEHANEMAKHTKGKLDEQYISSYRKLFQLK